MAEVHPLAQAQADIETLMRDLRRSGEWEDEHEDILARWRKRRGEDAMGDWRWWWKLSEDDLYQSDCATRDEALAVARREYPDAPEFELIEARSWADDITAGDGEDWFAESRNRETVKGAAND